MTGERHHRLADIFLAACELPQKQRAAYLDEACGGDTAMRAEVHELLRRDGEPDAFLERPALGGDFRLAAAPQPDDGCDRFAQDVPERIDDFRVLDRLGEGGMGVVYRAMQERPVRREVALKIIKLGMDTEQVIARFEAERQALAMMSHPHIATILDGGATEAGRPYFVMELAIGKPITEHCDDRTLSSTDRLRLFVNVCDAVHHAHQKGVIHRDIKPSNVLVTEQNDRAIPKVIDFGIATATHMRETERTASVNRSAIIGTPQYMSPEQAMSGDDDIDTRTDIYSLGVLLYELLTGTTPLDGMSLRRATYADIQRLITEEDPPRPSTRLSALMTSERTTVQPGPENDRSSSSPEDDGRDTPISTHHIARRRRTSPTHLSRELRGDLDWIVMKAIDKNRERRYRSASELAADIERHLSNEPVLAGPPSVAYRARKFVQRHRGAVFAGSALAAALMIAVASLAVGLVIVNQQRDIANASATLARTEAARARAVTDLVQSMFDSANPDENRGRNFTVRELLDEFSEGSFDTLDDQPLVAATLHTTVGSAYRALGMGDSAERHLTRALALRADLPDDHPDMAQAISNAALILHDHRLYDEALEVLQELLVTQERSGADPAAVADTRGVIGDIFRHLGRYDEAEPLIVEQLDTLRKQLGPDHEQTLEALLSLSLLRESQGRHAECEVLRRDALEGWIRLRGEHHPAADKMRIMLGSVLRHLGRYAEADELITGSIARLRERVGSDHPATLHGLRGLGHLRQAEGRLEEAAEAFEEVIETSDEVYGPDHVETLIAMANLGTTYAGLRRSTEAEDMLTRAIAGLSKVLGDDEATLEARGNLAGLLAGVGRADEAEAMYRLLLPTQRAVVGPDHHSTLGTQVNLASVCLTMGRPQEAETILVPTLAALERTMGERAAFTRTCIRALARSYLMQDRQDDAERTLVRLLPLEAAILGEAHRRTVWARHSLISLYLTQDRTDEARELAQQELRIHVGASEAPGADAATINMAAFALLTIELPELRDPRLARDLALRACEMTANEDPSCLATLARAHFELGETAMAVRTQQRAIELLPERSPRREEFNRELSDYVAALNSCN